MDSKRRRVNRGSSVENPSASTLPRTPASSSLALLRGRTNPSWKEFVQGPSARTAAAAPRYSGGGGDDMDKSDGGCASHSATMQRQREQIASMSQDMKELKAQLILADAARVKHDADMSAITVQLQRTKESFQHEQEARKIDIETECERAAELERQRAFFAEGEERLREELKNTRERHRNTIDKLNDRIKALESERQRLMDDGTAAQEIIRRTNASKESDELNHVTSDGLRHVELKNAMEEVAYRRRLLDEKDTALNAMRGTCAEQAQTIEDLRSQLARARDEVAAALTRGADGTSASAAAMSAAVARKVRSVEHENSNLRKQMENSQLLNSQLETYRAQLEALKPRAARVTSLELELADLQHLKGAWQKVREASGSDAALLDSPVSAEPRFYVARTHTHSLTIAPAYFIMRSTEYLHILQRSVQPTAVRPVVRTHCCLFARFGMHCGHAHASKSALLRSRGLSGSHQGFLSRFPPNQRHTWRARGFSTSYGTGWVCVCGTRMHWRSCSPISAVISPLLWARLVTPSPMLKPPRCAASFVGYTTCHRAAGST
eukprot:m.232970 g.232970  ORF g.232970 m.232970 type:complete len:552 (-) comp19284_c0_seq14:122-1777(-)